MPVSLRLLGQGGCNSRLRANYLDFGYIWKVELTIHDIVLIVHIVCIFSFFSFAIQIGSIGCIWCWGLWLPSSMELDSPSRRHGDMTDSFAGAGNLGNITFSNTTNASKCCLWYWFFWKLDEKSLTHSEVCGDLTKYALICSVLQEMEGSELWFICNECEKMIFTVIRTYNGSAGRDRWEKRALWS